MIRDSFPFAVGVSCEDELITFSECSCDCLDVLGITFDDIEFHGEIIVGDDGTFEFGRCRSAQPGIGFRGRHAGGARARTCGCRAFLPHG